MTVDQELDLAPGIGQRQATFRFELIDGANGHHLGEIHPNRDSAPHLGHDMTRSIKRDLGSLALDIQESADVNPLRDRVRIFMEIGGTSYRLGTYLFTDDAVARRSYGRRSNVVLLDLGLTLAQEREHSFGVFAGESISGAILRLLDEAEIGNRYVESSEAIARIGMAWPAGTPNSKIFDDLAATGGYLAPWFDHNDTFRALTAFDPATVKPEFDLDTSLIIHAESIAESNDLLASPNRFIAIDTANTTTPIVGTFDIPDSAPHSIFNRGGLVISEVFNVQGLGTQSAADNAAKARSVERTIYQRVSFTTPPDPRHDGWNVVRYDGHNWLELVWSMELIEGGVMSHSIRRAYL